MAEHLQIEAPHKLGRGAVLHRPETDQDLAGSGRKEAPGETDQAFAANLPAERGTALADLEERVEKTGTGAGRRGLGRAHPRIVPVPTSQLRAPTPNRCG